MSITYIERGEAVPAEDVLASLAHHLRAAGVPLNEHAAHRALFDRLVAVPGHHQVGRHSVSVAAPATAARHQECAVLGAGEAGVPGGQAQRAELLGTGGTGHGHTLIKKGYRGCVPHRGTVPTYCK